VILTPGGELYIPISDQMPDVDQRQKLMPLLGRYVRVSGGVYQRKGTRTIKIKNIEELKDVHLTIEDQ
jgi:DNA/RNA endonuclease YhcR with UshA esterase domain